MVTDRRSIVDAICELGDRATDRAYQVWRRLRAGRHDPADRSAETVCTAKTSRPHPPSLRPPTLMIDLLFGALMLFAFHMGDPNARSVVRQDVTLPTSAESAAGRRENLLPLIPIKSGKNWKYELIAGRRVSTRQALKLAREEKSRLVLIVAPDTPVQSYIDAEMPFRKLGVKVGLAVGKKGDRI